MEVDFGFLGVDFESLGIKIKHQEVDFRPLGGFRSLRVRLWPKGVDFGLSKLQRSEFDSHRLKINSRRPKIQHS